MKRWNAAIAEFCALSVANTPFALIGNAWISSSGTPQGSAAAAACGASPGHAVIHDAYFSSLGVSPGNANPGGAGITTTDTSDPLNVEFSCSVDGGSTGFGKPVNVNPQP